MVFGSCFTKDSFAGASGPRPALSSPQAFRLSGELSASFAKLMAAFRSWSRTRPHAWQWNLRSASVRPASPQPQPEQVLLAGSHRLATTTRLPYHAAL